MKTTKFLLIRILVHLCLGISGPVYWGGGNTRQYDYYLLAISNSDRRSCGCGLVLQPTAYRLLQGWRLAWLRGTVVIYARSTSTFNLKPGGGCLIAQLAEGLSNICKLLRDRCSRHFNAKLVPPAPKNAGLSPRGLLGSLQYARCLQFTVGNRLNWGIHIQVFHKIHLYNMQASMPLYW